MEQIADAVVQFQQEKERDIQAMTQDKNTKRIGRLFMDHVTDYKYGYYFTWMGRPIIQHPQDMVALQEVIMEVRPDLIIEPGLPIAAVWFFLHRCWSCWISGCLSRSSSVRL